MALKDSIETALTKFAEGIEDLSTVTVTTRYIIPGTDNLTPDQAKAQAKLLGQTVIKIDGDFEAIVPVRGNDGGVAIDSDLLNAHQINVKFGLDYRKDVIDQLVDLFRELT